MPGDLVLRGSIVTTRGRCGKQRCRCVDGELHERTALSVSMHNRTTLVTLRSEAEVAEVAAALERYREAAAELETRVVDSLAELRVRLAEGRSAAKGRA
jgi:hypothetical protein